MGQKIHPVGYRLSVRRDWQSRWFARSRDFSAMVLSDSAAREYILRQYPQAAISKIEIERPSKSARVVIHTARPGMVIGKKGEDIGKLRAKLAEILQVRDLSADIQEIRQPEREAQLIAMNIASQLERRIMFRRAMKRALANAMRLGAEGIKIMSSGRLNGAEIARTEWYREGRVPLHTLRADIDYGFAVAKTAMGAIGVKVWVFNGERFGDVKKFKRPVAAATPSADEAKSESAAESDSDSVDSAVAEEFNAKIKSDDSAANEAADSVATDSIVAKNNDDGGGSDDKKSTIAESDGGKENEES